MNWIKLTSSQAAEIEGLSESNPTSNFLTPRADTDGAFWISADILTDRARFSHYESVLADLTPSAGTPDLPNDLL